MTNTDTAALSNEEISALLDHARLATDSYCDGLACEPSKAESDAYFYRAIIAASPAVEAPKLTDERISNLMLEHGIGVGMLIGGADVICCLPENFLPFCRALLRHQPVGAILNAPVEVDFVKKEAIADIIQAIAELPDRTSPEDWPDAMLVTADELRDILDDRLVPVTPSIQPSNEAPITHDDALQALTDQAQELDMGYGQNACPTCGKSQPVAQPAPMPVALPESLLEFDAFLNEPPSYEGERMVREYRHAAYPKWGKVVADIRKALALLPAQQVVAVSKHNCPVCGSSDCQTYGHVKLASGAAVSAIPVQQVVAVSPDIKDAARLDWIIRNEVQVWEVNYRYSIHQVTEHHAITGEFMTARDAIDAAMTTAGGQDK